MNSIYSKIALLLLLISLSVSCIPFSKTRYFNDIDNLQPKTSVREKKIISPFDNLYVTVLSIDERANALFDVNASNSGQQYMVGYLVDENGNIDFPFLGKVKLDGLTITEASEKLQTALSEYVPRASVVVRFIENKVTILGYVENQGTHEYNSDNITIYEALSLGGGISQYGNRKKIILVREENGQTIQQRLDLSKSNIINSEYYYIMPNDILVVEPLRAIIWDYNNFTLPTIFAAITTFLAIYVIVTPN